MSRRRALQDQVGRHARAASYPAMLLASGEQIGPGIHRWAKFRQSARPAVLREAAGRLEELVWNQRTADY